MSSDLPDPVVELSHVTKRFGPGTRRSLVKEASPFFGRDPAGRVALDDVSLTVRPGEAVGIVGRNGAGKSTLLRLVAGIMEPSSGSVDVVGVPGSMIELGLAFEPELTGWENLPSAAALFGMGNEELERAKDDVVSFSGIRELLDLPVKHFSTGMIARLGFSLATHLSSSVLLIDEVLAVGDRRFQNQCIGRIRELVAGGAALMFVSHDLDLVCHVCDSAVCLESGRLVDQGTAFEVVGRYARSSSTPPGPRWRKVAQIASLGVTAPMVRSGESLEVECVIDVVEAGHHLRLSSQLYPPSSGVGAVNADDTPAGALACPGTYRASAAIGPLPSSAATLELEVALVETHPGTTRESLVDRRSVPFEILGEEMGAPLWLAQSSWHYRLAVESDQSDAAVRVAPRVADPVIRALRLIKQFASSAAGPIESMKTRPSRTVRPAITALDEVSFEIGKGEAVGLIGSNGAGKSTLLRVLAGVSDPTDGMYEVRGRTVAVLELGIGFHPEMTGEENVGFTWALEGGDPERLPEARHAIAEFADIGSALTEPVKRYSSGMRARLALATALELQPDVLLVDEALSTGDAEFRRRVLERLTRFCGSGGTLLLASHDLHMVSQLCPRVLRLESGELVDDGPALEVIASAGGAGWAGGTTTADGAVVVSGLTIAPDVVDWGEPLHVQFEVEVRRPSPTAYLEFSIRQTLDPHERLEPKSPSDVLQMSLCVEHLDEVAPALADVGRYIVSGVVDDIPAQNSADVVISVIDGVGGTVVSEQWHTIFLGQVSGADMTGRLAVSWSLVDR
jgi:ABC-type polysaccharide/polyol phosphate transport system ATPase subunit